MKTWIKIDDQIINLSQVIKVQKLISISARPFEEVEFYFIRFYMSDKSIIDWKFSSERDLNIAFTNLAFELL